MIIITFVFGATIFFVGKLSLKKTNAKIYFFFLWRTASSFDYQNTNAVQLNSFLKKSAKLQEIMQLIIKHTYNILDVNFDNPLEGGV